MLTNIFQLLGIGLGLFSVSFIGLIFSSRINHDPIDD